MDDYVWCVLQSGLTPLHVASFMGCMNIVIFLLQHEANPDVPTVRGETPLHLAARANQTDIIRILLRNGAKVDARARVSNAWSHLLNQPYPPPFVYFFSLFYMSFSLPPDRFLSSLSVAVITACSITTASTSTRVPSRAKTQRISEGHVHINDHSHTHPFYKSMSH